MITRLENTPFDYNTYPSQRIVELLKERHLKMTDLGSKEIKIQRLLNNDRLDREVDNYDDMMLHVRADGCRRRLKERVEKQEAISTEDDRSYSTSTWTLAKLRSTLQKRKLSSTGVKEDMIERLRADDRRQLSQNISEAREEYTYHKKLLESQIGHPCDGPLLETALERSVEKVDYELQSQARMSRPGIPVCDYDGSESHWASKTERQLLEICRSRGMNGFGPKDAMIKWLNTGSVEYEDLYAFSLERMCNERGIGYRRHAKKEELVRQLKEADELLSS